MLKVPTLPIYVVGSFLINESASDYQIYGVLRMIEWSNGNKISNRDTQRRETTADKCIIDWIRYDGVRVFGDCIRSNVLSKLMQHPFADEYNAYLIAF